MIGNGISQLKVKKEHLIFDLELFFLGKGLSDGAVLLITPNQFILTDCFVKLYEDDNFGSHFDAVSVMYEALYGDNSVLKDNPFMWSYNVIGDGNICIQLCTGTDMSVSLICIPDTITAYQYNCLVEFNNKIKDIYQRNKAYFDKYPIGFVSSDSDFECDSINNIDSILNNIYDRIGEVSGKDVIILGTRINNDANFNNIKKCNK